MSEEIKICDLKGREKQIFEYAYREGYGKGVDSNVIRRDRIWSAIAVVVLGIVFITVVYIVTHR